MIRTVISATLLALGLGGCTIPIAFRSSPTCRADEAIGYIGQRYSDRIGRIVRKKTGAVRARIITPNVIVTTERARSRINIGLDERNLITAIYCG